MEKQDWIKVVKWMGYAYLPIALLVIGIFILIEWNAHKLDTLNRQLGLPSAASSTRR